jgi:plasmid stabilization system protein ParE
MSRSFRLTRRAEASLTEIARWTIESFELRQAELYEAELLSRCESILSGQAYSRSCAVLVDDVEDLRFIRAGEHFLVLDILHSRSDLPRHVASLSALKSEDS